MNRWIVTTEFPDGQIAIMHVTAHDHFDAEDEIDHYWRDLGVRVWDLRTVPA